MKNDIGSWLGQQLGPYRLIKILGEGGFAEVYLGVHIHLDIRVAIKVLKARLSDDKAIEVFLQEARTVAQLMHPNIVRMLHFDVEKGTPFLVMDYAPNGTLRELHSKGTRLTLPDIVSYVKQVAAALQYAHDERLIHRDIKPENMLLSRRNEILVSDFGIAVTTQSTFQQVTQNVAGSASYMAPEQSQGHPLPASDQYSLGVVVYEWLCGECPFQGSSFNEVALKHITAPLPPLRGRVPDISPEVEQVVYKALEKDYRARFPRIQDFATALEQAIVPTAVRSSFNLPAAYPSINRTTSQTIHSSASNIEPTNGGQSTMLSPIQAATSQPPQYYAPMMQQPGYAPPLQQPIYSNGYYPTVPQPIGIVPPSVKAKPVSYLPLMHGKVSIKDALLIPGYSIMFLLCSLPLFLNSEILINTYSSTNAVASLFALLLWIFVVLPLGTFFAGALLGGWRGVLSTLLYDVVLFICFQTFIFPQASIAASAPRGPYSNPSSSFPPLLAYSIIIAIPLSSLIVGLLYERRRATGCLSISLTILLCSFILGVSIFWQVGAVGLPDFIFISSLLICGVERAVQKIVAVMQRRRWAA